MSNENSTYGCLFCRSGSEETLIGDLKSSHPHLICLSPKKVRVRRQGEHEIVTLFPGYIFFHTSLDFDMRALVQKANVYRLLRYPNGEWKLHGSDLHMAMMLFEIGEIIELSRARFDGNKVEILSGPLIRFKKYITKINKRAKTAQVTIDFHGEILIMWLGLEIEASTNILTI